MNSTISCSHHAKEEKLLFPLLAERSSYFRSFPLNVLLSDHRKGRGHVAKLREYLASNQKDPLAERQASLELANYALLLRTHIAREDQAIFLLARSLLSEGQLSELAERFEQVERQEMGVGVHERFEALVDKIEEVAKAD